MFYCRATIKIKIIFFLLTTIFSLCAESATTLTITPATSYDGNYTLSWVGDGAGVTIVEAKFDEDVVIGGSGSSTGSYTFTGKAPGYYEYFLYVHSRSGTKTKTSHVSVNVVPAKVGTPSINPNGGTYTGQASVAISQPTYGATIRYTTDGSSVTTSSPLYSQPIVITKNATVKARAFKSGMTNSDEVSASFTVRVATPSISPNGATFKGSGLVSLVSSSSGTTIRYTTDGSAVTISSSLYTSPISITGNTTLKAKAFKTGALESAEASASFLVAALPPAFSPNGASFPGSGQVTLTPKTAGSTIRYTTNGSAVTASSTTYSAPISVNTKTTIKAKAFKNGMADSEEANALFLAGTTGKPVSIKYTYDALGRLREVKENNTEKTKYKYDPAGNREVVTEAPMK